MQKKNLIRSLEFLAEYFKLLRLDSLCMLVDFWLFYRILLKKCLRLRLNASGNC